MKIGLICDIHMPDNENSAQLGFLKKAVCQLKEDGICLVINVGDIAAAGEYEGYEQYTALLKDFESFTLIGNSDVRNKETAQKFLAKSSSFKYDCDGVSLWGINTPYAEIDDADKEMLSGVKDGDVVFLHHSIPSLKEESREFLTNLANEKEITIIHAHSHKWLDYQLGKSRVVCIRALDPDKSVGNFPCITYYDTESKNFEEKLFAVSNDTIENVKNFFGISCVDNHRDLDYATENGIYAVELRLNGSDWEPDYSLVSKLEEWRTRTNGYLSVHMPNLKYKDGEITGKEKWFKAVEYAKNIGADGMTIHPPKVNIHEIEKVWDELLELYVYAVKNVDERVKIGIENVHMGKEETEQDRGFGYTPSEVSKWIDEINVRLEKPGRVRHTFDVGHARNNGALSRKFPISRWYETMGNKTVAYHIHQVVPAEGKYKNHRPIENWFGPMISYVSFFYSWENGIINKCPVFLEVRGCDNYQKSIEGFKKCFFKEA